MRVHVHRFAELKRFSNKVMKFKQGKLLGLVAADDDLLTEIIRAFKQMEIPREKWEALIGDTGACGIFSAHWLSEVVRGNRDDDLRMSDSKNHTLITFQAMFRNVFLKEKVSNRAFLKTLITDFYGMKTVEEPIIIGRLSQIVDLHRGMNYYISADSTIGTPHAVAFSMKNGGMFFDPNAGEYHFNVLRSGDYLTVFPTMTHRYNPFDARSNTNLADFFDAWQRIYVRDFVTPFTTFSVYPVAL
jgi:hypothetical protein